MRSPMVGSDWVIALKCDRNEMEKQKSRMPVVLHKAVAEVSE